MVQRPIVGVSMLNALITSAGVAARANVLALRRASAEHRVGSTLANLAAAVIIVLVLFSARATSAELGDALRGRAYAERICALCAMSCGGAV